MISPATAAPTHPRSVRRWVSGSDRGDGPVTASILIPLLLLLVMTVIGVGYYAYGSAVANGAAQAGLEVARGYQAPAGAGQAAAEQYLAQTAPDLLPNAQVSVVRGAMVTVTVTSDAPGIIPGLPRLTVTAAGPVERVTTP